MRLITEPYLTQRDRWPTQGRHLLAQYTAETIIVYQAYRESIGRFAVSQQYFGGDFSLNRMSWIKPNFLWMMYRSAWGTAPGQEVILAVSLQRAAFDTILAESVSASYDALTYPDERAWRDALQRTEVVRQWDPDHLPSGQRTQRRALQLGLRGAALARYAHEWVVAIEDLSEFVREQRPLAQSGEYAALVTPTESPYPITDPTLARHCGLASSLPDEEP